jgi:hypothetical protein
MKSLHFLLMQSLWFLLRWSLLVLQNGKFCVMAKDDDELLG